MKTKLLALLLCLSMGARADNIVNISSVEGSPSQEVTLSIGLQNSDALSSLQLSIPLDENLTLVAGSAQTGSRCPSHAVNVGVNGGTLQVVVYSVSMATIASGSGEVASFRLKLGDEPISATLQATKLVLTDASGNAINGSSQSGTVTIRCAKAQWGSDEIDFGRVPIRSTYTQNVAVTNVGNANLVVSNMEFSDVNVFSTTTQLPKTIAPGATAYMNVTYAPIERGTIERQLRIASNSSTRNRAIKLKAQPYAVNELHIGDASGVSDKEVTINMRMNNMDDISGYQVEFLLPSSLQYVDGSFEVNTDRKQDHVGAGTIVDGALRIMAYSPSGKPLLGNDGEIGSFRVKLVGKNSVNLTPVKTILTATINDVVENVVSDVYGGGVTIQYPSISTNGTLDFGAVPITEECKKIFAISNYGSAPLTINRIVFNNENLSVVEEMPMVIQSWQSSNVTVVYNSIEETDFEAKMQIYSNDPERRLHEVSITGSRFAPNYLNLTTPDIFEEEVLKVNVALDTYDEITGLQFDLEYPNNLFEPFDGNVQVAERASGMTVNSQQTNNNTIRYVCYFLTGGSVAVGDGDIMTISFRPIAEITPKGIYNVSVSNVKLGTAGLSDKYAGNNVSSSFRVKEHNPVIITAKSYTRMYGDSNPAFEFTSEGASVVGQPSFVCEATVLSPIGEYPIVISKGSVENEEDTYVNGILTITKAPLRVSAGTYTKKQGEAMPEFVPVFEGFKNSETKSVLTRQPAVKCEANEASAPGEYPVTVSGAAAQNYEISYVSGKLTVTEADPVVVTAMSYTREYGDSNPVFGYTSAGKALEGEPEIVCEATATSPVGEYPIIIRKGSVTNYNDTYVNGILTITKAPLRVSAGTYTKKQGESMPEFTLSYEGFKNGETKSVLTRQPAVKCEASEASAPGEYPVTVSGAAAQNYEISYVSGKLTVTEADPVVVTAMSYTREYGDSNPVFGYTSAGKALEGEPEIVCEATATSPVGEYPIIIRKGSVTNYNDTYVDGVLTIKKASLVVTVQNAEREEGEEDPDFIFVYSGWKNGENENVLIALPTATTTATIGSPPGEYPIILSGGIAQNYEFVYVNGVLTVTELDAMKVVLGENKTFDVYTLDGRKIRHQVTILKGLPQGIYIINGRKRMVK